jgi:hypothetical protein
MEYRMVTRLSSCLLCLSAVIATLLSGCSSVQINRSYKKTPLPDTLFIAPSSNMIFQIDTAPDTFNTPVEKRDREQENRIKVSIENKLSQADTRFSFIYSGTKAITDEYQQIVFDIFSGIKKSGIEKYTVPDVYKKYFSCRKARFAVVICHTGFYRTESNKKSMAKAAAATVLASLGTLVMVYEEASTFFQYCVIDTDTMRVVLYNGNHFKDDPRSENVMLQHLGRLVRDIAELGT